MVSVKLILILFFSLLFNINIYCQTDSSFSSFRKENQCIVFSVKSMPEYKGGIKALMKFIKKNINYPKTAINENLEGTVYVECLVDTNGITYNHKIIKGISKELDYEALRVAKIIKFDKPAMQNGKPVVVKYLIPIKFE